MSTGETTGQNTGNLHAGHLELNLGLNLETICITNQRLDCKLRYGQPLLCMAFYYAWLDFSPYKFCAAVLRAEAERKEEVSASVTFLETIGLV